jgi:hypothetical protein
LQFLCGMTLIEYVCQDVLNVIRFGVLIGYKIRCRSVSGYLGQIISQFRFGALLGTQVHHRSVLG